LEILEIRVLAPTSKGRKERVVPLAKAMAGLLQEWRESQRPKNVNEEVQPLRRTSWPQLTSDRVNVVREDF
jgi:integrase